MHREPVGSRCCVCGRRDLHWTDRRDADRRREPDRPSHGRDPGALGCLDGRCITRSARRVRLALEEGADHDGRRHLSRGTGRSGRVARGMPRPRHLPRDGIGPPLGDSTGRERRDAPSGGYLCGPHARRRRHRPRVVEGLPSTTRGCSRCTRCDNSCRDPTRRRAAPTIDFGAARPRARRARRAPHGAFPRRRLRTNCRPRCRSQ